MFKRKGRKRKIIQPLIIVGLTLIAVYYYINRPTHSRSDIHTQPITAVRWTLSGAVTPDTATVKSKLEEPANSVNLLLSTHQDLSDPIIFQPTETIASEQIYHFNLTDLQADTEYFYGIRVDNMVDVDKIGRFQTFPNQPSSFSFAIGSCAQSGSNGAVFDAIRQMNPRFFLVSGDLHYENLEVADSSVYHAAYDMTFTRPAQSAVHRQMPLVYIWDDHDYGDNNSDGGNKGKTAVRQAYQQAIPHYPLAAGAGDNPIYQSFHIGRVRFILTDLRSAKDNDSNSDNAQKTMMGTTQKAWFKQELLNGRDNNQLILWVNTVPWNGAAQQGSDNWAGYATERQELANFIAENSITNLAILSGDAHMLAIDDGTNSNFATIAGHTAAEKKGMPLFHAAALDRFGSTKGGQFSHGTYPGGGQFGIVNVTDNGKNQIEITFTGYNHKLKEIVSYTTQFKLTK